MRLSFTSFICCCSMMVSLLRGFLLLTIAAVSAAASEAVANDTQDVLISDLITWLRANGSFINEKLQIRHVNANDPKSPRGLFALESLEEGETICNIPWDLMIKPIENSHSKSEQLDCGTINAVIEELSKSAADMTPYGKYLLSQPRGYTLGFWSEEGQELFWEMTNDEVLPPIWIEESVEVWEEVCDGDVENDDHVFAVMLVKARADYKYLVPFYGESWLLFEPIIGLCMLYLFRSTFLTLRVLTFVRHDLLIRHDEP